MHAYRSRAPLEFFYLDTLGVKEFLGGAVLEEQAVNIIHQFPCIRVVVRDCCKVASDIRPEIKGAVRERARATDAAHDVALFTLRTFPCVFHRASALFYVVPAIEDQHVYAVVCELVCCAHPSRPSSYDDDVQVRVLINDGLQAERPNDGGTIMSFGERYELLSHTVHSFQ